MGPIRAGKNKGGRLKWASLHEIQAYIICIYDITPDKFLKQRHGRFAQDRKLFESCSAQHVRPSRIRKVGFFSNIFVTLGNLNKPHRLSEESLLRRLSRSVVEAIAIPTCTTPIRDTSTSFSNDGLG